MVLEEDDAVVAMCLAVGPPLTPWPRHRERRRGRVERRAGREARRERSPPPGGSGSTLLALSSAGRRFWAATSRGAVQSNDLGKTRIRCAARRPIPAPGTREDGSLSVLAQNDVLKF
jgi:hypothetical protein